MIGGFSPLELALFMVAVEEFRLEKLERVASRVSEKVSRRFFLAWAEEGGLDRRSHYEQYSDGLPYTEASRNNRRKNPALSEDRRALCLLYRKIR